MAKTIEYRQCTLRKMRSPSASSVTVSYIPANFAHYQRVLKLKRADGSWDDGWVVEHVGARLSSDDLPDTHHASAPDDQFQCVFCGKDVKGKTLLNHFLKKHAQKEYWEETIESYFGW